MRYSSLLLLLIVMLLLPTAKAHEETPGKQHDNIVSSPPMREQGQEHHVHEGATEPEPQSFVPRLIEYSGKFHVVVVHFPIALTLGALLGEVLFLLTARMLFRDAARCALVLSAISILAVVPFGWAAAASESFSGEAAQVLLWHRWVGTGAGILVLITTAMSECTVRYQGKKWIRPIYLALLALSAGAIAATGHLGGMLVHGLDFLTW